MRITVRVFIEGLKYSEATIEAGDDLEDVMELMAAQHAGVMVKKPGMVEIEFLDEPDPLQRFYRVGTDPSQMVRPVRADRLFKEWPTKLQ